MYRDQLRRSQSARLVAIVMDDLVFQTQLLEQPQDALRARVLQVMNGNHGGFLRGEQAQL